MPSYKWSFDETAIIREEVAKDVDKKTSLIIQAILPRFVTASATNRSVRKEVDEKKLGSKVGNIKNQLKAATRLAFHLPSKPKSKSKSKPEPEELSESSVSSSESSEEEEEEKPRKSNGKRALTEEESEPLRPKPSPHSPELRSEPHSGPPSEPHSSSMTSSSMDPEPSTCTLPVPNDIPALAVSFELKWKSQVLEASNLDWIQMIVPRLPTGMVRYAQHRLRAGKLLLALFPPYGFDLSLEMDQIGHIGFVFTRVNFASELHDWYNIVTNEDHSSDPTKAAYPVHLPLSVPHKVFLPLHKKQDTNRDALLLPMDKVLELGIRAYTLSALISKPAKALLFTPLHMYLLYQNKINA